MHKWLSALDTNDWLLGFDDTVYDFKEKRFRDGVPADVLTISTIHKNQDVLQRDPVVFQEIMKSIDDMH